MSRARRESRVRLALPLLPLVLLAGLPASAHAQQSVQTHDAGSAAAAQETAAPDPALLLYMNTLTGIASETAEAKAAFGHGNPTANELARAYEALARAQAELKILAEARENKTPEAAAGDGDLNGRLKRALKQAADLQQEFDTPSPAPTHIPSKPSSGIPVTVMDKGKEPIMIHLAGKHVAPMTGQYFKVTTGILNGQGGRKLQVIQISRIKDGEPIQTAKKDGGVLAALVKSSNPKKQYFAFLVCADAIDTFREARGIVSQHGFSFFWTTAQDGTMISAHDPNQTQDKAAQPGVPVTPPAH